MLCCPNKYGKEAVEFSGEGGATFSLEDLPQAMKSSELYQEACWRQAELFPLPIFLSSGKKASFSGATVWRQIGWIMDKIFLIVLYLVLTNSALLTHQGFFVVAILRFTKLHIFAWMKTKQELTSFLCTFLSVSF